MITSSQNAKLKQVRALVRKPNERRRSGEFVVEGVRLMEEALASGGAFRYALFSKNLSDRGRALVEKLADHSVEVEEVAESLMGAVSDAETPPGLLAVLDRRPLPFPPSPDFLLIADRIREPGNLGTLLRTAAAAGVQGVLLSPDTTDAFSPKALRSGMGAQFRLPVQEQSWADIARFCETTALRIFLATMTGTSCWTEDFRRPLALVIGGEADGASPEAIALARHGVAVPMPGGMESLNAAVAGAILLFEVVRQRAGGVAK
ncbi:MAG: RNA methyltransferase [Kiritimatiellia bacterium]|nr:RNA methyltransferase [Kiritimatiellia bacterium]